MASTTKHLCCITLDQTRCLPTYLQSAFLWHPAVRKQLRRAAKGSIMEGLNMEIINNLRIPLPPLSAQRRWVDLVGREDHLRNVEVESLRQADHLFSSLLARAFGN